MNEIRTEALEPLKAWKPGILPLNLQFFGAAGDPAPTDPPPTDPPPTDPPPKVATFDELLKDPKHQAEFDRRITKALETGKANWLKEQGMTAEQLAAQKTAEKEATLAAKEKDLNQRELKAKAQGILAEKKLPARLANRLDYTDEAAMTASLKEVEEDFRAALEQGVNDRLKGNPPPSGAPADAGDAAMRKAMGLPPVKK